MTLRGYQASRLVRLPTKPSRDALVPGVPIVGRNGVVGNLCLTEKTGGEVFPEEDEGIEILPAAASAAAVENVRHDEEGARLLEEVQRLHRARERLELRALVVKVAPAFKAHLAMVENLLTRVATK